MSRSVCSIEEPDAVVPHVRIRGSRGCVSTRGHPVPIPDTACGTPLGGFAAEPQGRVPRQGRGISRSPRSGTEALPRCQVLAALPSASSHLSFGMPDADHGGSPLLASRFAMGTIWRSLRSRSTVASGGRRSGAPGRPCRSSGQGGPVMVGKSGVSLPMKGQPVRVMALSATRSSACCCALATRPSSSP